MSHRSGGLAAAIAGELSTGVSIDRKEPERITCKWPCSTVLRVGARPAALRIRARLQGLATEIVQAQDIPESELREYEHVDSSSDGLCALHQDKFRDYNMGLEPERPPFLSAMIKKRSEENDAPKPDPEQKTESEDAEEGDD